MGMTFTRARRAQARLRLALIAVSGGGKTMGALRVANGIVQGLLDMGVIEGGIEGKIAMIDTERKSASLYADVAPFDALELEPPYSVDRYMQALDAAERAGYVVCIIDQISHAWAGPGGQLEYIDTLKAQSRNAISPWAKVTPLQQEFYDRILRSPMHIIATMRAKSEYVIDDVIVDGRTKKVPRKIGLAPVQREGIEYEFTACLDIDLEAHMATASKDRTRLFMGRSTRLDEETGRRLAEWLQSGEKTTVDDSAGGAGQAAGADADDAGKQQDETSRHLLAKLSLEVGDFEKGFSLCTTLPDLADHWNKAQKHIRSYAKDLGSEAVLPFIASASKAKDARKEAIQRETQDATGGFKTVLIDSQGKVITEIDGRLEMDQVVRIGNFDYVVGGATSQSDQADVRYAKKKEETEPADPGAGGPADPGAGGDAAPTDLLGEPAAESAAPPPPAKTRRTSSAAAA